MIFPGSIEWSDCPDDFTLISGGCYYLSNTRVGWIEARKMCEQRNSRLVSLETADKKNSLLDHIADNSRRRRTEYWLDGNDIEEEGVWEWAKSRTPVAGFGWLEEPYTSAEENCLSWTVAVARRRGGQVTDGWGAASCCNNLRYICQL